MNRLVQYSAKRSWTGAVAVALLVLGGTSIFSPALADHEDGHDEIARGKIGALEERVWNCENDFSPCESIVGDDGAEGPIGPIGPIGIQGIPGPDGVDGPLAGLNNCGDGQTVAFNSTSGLWECADGGAEPPPANTCPCEALAGGGGEVAGMIGQAAGQFLRNLCSRFTEEDLAACLDSMRCDLQLDTRPAGGEFLIFLTGIDPGNNFLQLMNWRYAASREDDPGSKFCSARVLDTFTIRPAFILLLRDERREEIRNRDFGLEVHNPFDDSEIDDCVATLETTALRIEAAIGRFVGKEDFTCARF